MNGPMARLYNEDPGGQPRFGYVGHVVTETDGSDPGRRPPPDAGLQAV